MKIIKGFSGSKATTFIIDLLVVSLGVYFAFQIDNFRQQLAEKKVKQNYYQLILREFKFNLIEVQHVKDNVDQQLKHLTSADVASQPEAIRSLTEVDLSNNMLVIKAAFDSGHLENLNPLYVSSLSQGANAITRIAESILRYNNKIDRLLARHDYDTSLLFAQNSQLHPRYHWIISELELIQQYLELLLIALDKGAIPDTEKLVKG